MRAALFALASWTAVACGGESSVPIAPNAAPPAAVTGAPSTGSVATNTSAPVAPSPNDLAAHLQAVSESAVLETKRPGAVIAFDPSTGAVYAHYSVRGSRGDPLVAAHLPGSTFKAFTAIAGLEAGVLTTATEKECTGTFRFHDQVLRCAKVHGRETTSQAIARSCNAFFYDVGARMPHARTLEIARRFGFGTRTGIELPDEPGSVPDATRAARIDEDARSTVPLLDAIGHGEITVTLLQLARAYAVIANGGSLVRLSLAHQGGVERAVPIRPADLALVRSALVDVVEKEDGTAHAIAVAGFPFAGKTGSAEAPAEGGNEADDTWFVAYAPPSDAKILVAARVEHADPASDAKLVVRKVLDEWRGAR